MRNQKIYIEQSREKEPSALLLLAIDLFGLCMLVVLLGIVTLGCVAFQD